jgi:hypothetical protein
VWLELLDVIPADILLLGCNTGEISKQTLPFSGSADSKNLGSCFAVRHAFIYSSPKFILT